MNDSQPKQITEDNLSMFNLSEYVHNVIGEASTLFHRNDERTFDEEAALKLAERVIKGVTKLVNEASN